MKDSNTVDREELAYYTWKFNAKMSGRVSKADKIEWAKGAGLNAATTEALIDNLLNS